MLSIDDYSSDRFLIQLSFSFCLTSKDGRKKLWTCRDPGVSLKEMLMKRNSDFIHLRKLRDERYWEVSDKQWEKINADVNKGGSPFQERRQRLVAAALDYGERINFLGEHPQDSTLQTTKLVVLALAARSQMYHQKCLRKKIMRYILPELKVEIEGKRFLLIPCITLWDCPESNSDSRKSQFFTINIILIPERSGSLPLNKMSEFIDKISIPKHHGVRIKTLNENNVVLKSDLLEDVLGDFVTETCTLFDAEIAGEPGHVKPVIDYSLFENLMVSAICDVAHNETGICLPPEYPVKRDLKEEHEEETEETLLSKILFGFIYKSFWVDSERMELKKEKVPDILEKLSQNQIIYLPYNISCFFSETKHLSLNILLTKEDFPDYSGIWALGIEILANENISAQLCLISSYNDRLRKSAQGRSTLPISRTNSEIRKDKILDFEPFYNMETDDSYLKHRIDKMQSKMGIQQKYQTMNQCIESLSTLTIEKENGNIQINMMILTLVAAIIGGLSIFDPLPAMYRVPSMAVLIVLLILILFLCLKRKEIMQFFI